jgi:hypothetical protein
MTLPIRRWDLVRRRGLVPKLIVDTHLLAVDPHLLSRAIAFYPTHPQERAGLGTEAGHARLLAGTQPSPAG